MKKLSIIIPHYNSVNLLKNLIDSIPKNDNIEIIVVDDNSTQDIKEFNKIKMSARYQHVIFLTNNTQIQSAGKCRNIGLEVATGEWILFADSDDFFVNDFYEIIKKYFNTNNDVVLFTPTSIYLDTHEKSDRHVKFSNLIRNYNKNRSIKNEIKLRYEYVVPWSKMIKRSLINEYEIRFDEVIAMNDIMFSTKVGYYMKEFVASNEIIYCVTRNKGSLTMQMTKEVHDSRVDALLRYYKFLIGKLDKKEIKYLNISSIAPIVRAYKAKLGFKEMFSTYILFRKNNIGLLDRRFLNPLFVIKNIYQNTIGKFKEERYYVKRN